MINTWLAWPSASPRLVAGVVLAALVWHLARGAHARLIASLQRRVAHKLGGNGWTNLGAPGAPSYEAACAALAEAVCSTEKVDGPILSVGCGSSGKELSWLAERYGTSVIGVDATATPKTFNERIRLLRGRADDLRCGSRCHGLVVAVDCAYHFHLDSFLSEAFKALKPGGLLRFSRVHNELPDWIDPATVPESVIGFSVDYRYMIRWKAGLMWEMPELSSYEYVWMLDTDAFILGPISYDPFAVMAAKNATYGYIDVNVETPEVAGGLADR